MRQAAWPWQERALKETLELLGQGILSVAVTAPTGMGKGRMIEDLVLHFVERGGRCIIFTDRKMLTKQTGERFRDAGLHFGYASAEHGMDTRQNIIVASLQTIRSRLKRAVMELPSVDLVVVDEAHKRGFRWIVERYRRSHPGVSVVGFTASPVGLSGLYDKLVVAGTKPEGRAGAALVKCRVIAPSEPDMRGVRMTKHGEYEHKGMARRVMQCTVFADIFDTWSRWGQGRPTLVWAPGVPESRWVVQEFERRGITAAHIDGQTGEDERDEIRRGSQEGWIQVVSSFGVLREGVDWPWLSYGILLQVCGAYETFVQLVGRILRAYPGKGDAVLQDHSGTWWRHGSPNFDREWSLEDTNASIAAERTAQAKPSTGSQDGGAASGSDPICCHKCHGIRLSGEVCPHCGYRHTQSVRMIRKESGELVAMKDSPATPRKERSPLERSWASALFRCGSTGRTFAQARAILYRETKTWILSHPEIQPQPKTDDDWNKKVADLYPKYNRRATHGIL